ncbi:GNAT family N-acetyltransferase [Microbacterium sp. T32]|uniref:GNAT family N-acetyltransferase n=1 Tax=Microbacterium sp. T32 TaxID=1776083 RepID=UPI0009EF23C1
MRDFGEWDPDTPHGYARHAVRVIAQRSGETVGHVGWSRRTIDVGGDEVGIAGVGGVLVADAVRDKRVGSLLMASAAEAMRTAGGLDFGCPRPSGARGVPPRPAMGLWRRALCRCHHRA